MLSSTVLLGKRTAVQNKVQRFFAIYFVLNRPCVTYTQVVHNQCDQNKLFRNPCFQILQTFRL